MLSTYLSPLFSPAHSHRSPTLKNTLHDLHKQRAKENSVFLLDGGTGEELFRRGVPDDRKIWSATAVVRSQYHSILKQVHKSYIRAGSNAITTNTFGIVPGVGFEEEDILNYVSIAANIASESCSFSDEKKPKKQAPFIFGSLGPLVESYRPDLILHHEKGVKIYTKIMNSMHPYIHAYLAETMSSVEEAFQIIDAVASSARKDMPLLVSFTLDQNGYIRSGEEVVSGLNRVLDHTKQKKTCVLSIASSPPRSPPPFQRRNQEGSTNTFH